MKRNIERCPGLKPFYPLIFWSYCSKCKKEFRRMKGWKVMTGPYCGGTKGILRCICSDCAATKKEAEDFFLNRDWIPPRPTYRPLQNRKKEEKVGIENFKTLKEAINKIINEFEKNYRLNKNEK